MCVQRVYKIRKYTRAMNTAKNEEFIRLRVGVGVQ